MNSETKVSVFCAAYNHEKYIAQALESFVTQQTSFKFEVIVHDDASTDSTAEIIREYEKKWPDIIKAIYQTENQYSRGISVTLNNILPAAKGKYVAICEGDDYWTDPTKLQQQVDYMETHPDCPLVAHESICVFEDGKYMSKFSARDFSAHGACYLNPEEVIGHVNDFHTSSLFFRREQYLRNLEFLDTVPLFDYVTKIVMATDMPGDVYIIPNVMSAYRVAADGSWSRRIRDDNKKYQGHIKTSIETLKKIDAYREYKYHDALEREILERQFHIEILQSNKSAWKKAEYRHLIEGMSRRKRMTAYLQMCAPKMFKVLQKMYRRIKKYIEK